MKILYICNEYPPGRQGGIGSFTHDLATGMVRRKHQVVVVGSYSEIQTKISETIDGVHVIRLPSSNLSGWMSILDAFRMNRVIQHLVKKESIDIVEGAEASYWLYWSRNPKIRLIRIHGGHTFFRATLGKKPGFFRHWMEKISFFNASDICAVSRFVASETRSLLKLRDRPIEVIPNPVDIKLFSPRPEIIETNGLIVFIGTVSEKKGVRQLVLAMSEIIRKVPEAHLQIIGRDTLDPITGESYIQNLLKIVPAQISEKVHFVGAVERHLLPNRIALASVCVYPSQMESQGIAIIEAMAMAKMVIASLAGPGPEIIQDGKEGFLCNPHDPKSIAEKVVVALKNPILRQNLGQGAREKAVNLFSLEKMLPQNEEFYKQILHTKSLL